MSPRPRGKKQPAYNICCGKVEGLYAIILLCFVVDSKLEIRKICRCVGGLFFNNVVDCRSEGITKLNFALLIRTLKKFYVLH